jgi:hypothetical protein
MVMAVAMAMLQLILAMPKVELLEIFRLCPTPFPTAMSNDAFTNTQRSRTNVSWLRESILYEKKKKKKKKHK